MAKGKRKLGICLMFAMVNVLLVVANGVKGQGEGIARDAGQGDVVMRVGVYDTRAVAVAYARSEGFASRLKAMTEARSEAQKAGDTKKVAELDAAGEAMQVRLHLQSFSTAPVSEELEGLNGHLREVALKAGVSVITSGMDYKGNRVEVVDVTDEVVAVFKPTEQTLKVIEELRKQQPMAIEEAAKLSAKG